MKLRFEAPKHGWIKFQIINDNDTHEQVVSDVPMDSLSILVCAIQNLLNGSYQESVEWSLEPNFEKWEFVKNKNDLKLTIFSTTNQDVIFEYEENIEKMVVSIYRSLRGLESYDIWKDAPNKAWSWDFPSQGLANIKLKIKGIA